jgi:hypothetical protein
MYGLWILTVENSVRSRKRSASVGRISAEVVAGSYIPASALELLSKTSRKATHQGFGTVVDPFNTSCRRKERASQICKAMFHDRGQPSGLHHRKSRITYGLSHTASKVQSRLSPDHRPKSGAEVFAVSSFSGLQRGMFGLFLMTFQASLVFKAQYKSF